MMMMLSSSSSASRLSTKVFFFGALFLFGSVKFLNAATTETPVNVPPPLATTQTETIVPTTATIGETTADGSATEAADGHGEDSGAAAGGDAASNNGVIEKFYLEKCKDDDNASLAGSLFIAFGACATLEIMFSIVVAVVLYFAIAKLGGKMREAETHLHQVMDATLCSLIPQSVITEINAVALEAQMQFKKPKESSKKEKTKETSKKETSKKEKTKESSKKDEAAPATPAADAPKEKEKTAPKE